MFRLTPTVKIILIINVGLFVVEHLMTSSLGLSYSLGDIFGLRVFFSELFAIYQPMTYMWFHANFSHIFSNMLAVFFFGPMIEQVLGSKRFLQFYIICGVGAGILYGLVDYVEKYPIKKDTEQYVSNPNPEQFYTFILDHDIRGYGYHHMFESLYVLQENYSENPNNDSLKNASVSSVYAIYDIIANINMIGASGAVFGLLLAFALFFPNTSIYIYFLFPVKAKYLVLFYALYEIYAEFSRAPGDNIAHLAHIGGMGIAFVLLKAWKIR